MLQPKRVKYRRPHSLSYEGNAKGGTEVEFGEYGLMALEGNYITEERMMIKATVVKDGRVIKVEGVDGYPNNDGHLCVRGASTRDVRAFSYSY